MKDLELERLRLTVEQAAARERKLLDENNLLDQKVELLRTECRDTERKAQDNLLEDRAELFALRKRVEYYESMETDLDSAIQKVAEGDLGTADDASLALGAVLATTPTASSRRLQESLTLARTLYKRQRELAAAEERISKLEKHLEHARIEAQAADEARAVATQPQEYLIESIREKEKEIQFLKRRNDALDKELTAVRRELVDESNAKVEAEKDLQGVLGRREKLYTLQNMVLQADGGSVVQPIQQVRPAQPRQARQPRSVPIWYEKLTGKAA